MSWRFWRKKDADIEAAEGQLTRSRKAIARTVDLEKQAEQLKTAHKNLRESNGFYEKIVQLYKETL